MRTASLAVLIALGTFTLSGCGLQTPDRTVPESANFDNIDSTPADLTPAEPRPAPSPTPVVPGACDYNLECAKIHEPFTQGSFEVTVTDVEIGVRKIRPFEWESYEADYGEDYRDYISRPENGQYVVVYVTAKNVDVQPASFSTYDSMLLDDKGREFAGVDLADAEGQELGSDDLQPDTSRDGLLVFDVPPSVTGVATVFVQSDPYLGTELRPTAVAVN